MFVSKFIKLLGHYIRYPADFLLLPVSIFFGYFHGLIKLYAAFTLNVVCVFLPSSSPVPVLRVSRSSCSLLGRQRLPPPPPGRTSCRPLFHLPAKSRV